MPGQYYTNGQVPAYQQQPQQNNQSFVNYNYNSQILVDNTDQNNSSFVANGVGSSGNHYVNQQQIQNTPEKFQLLPAPGSNRSKKGAKQQHYNGNQNSHHTNLEHRPGQSATANLVNLQPTYKRPSPAALASAAQAEERAIVERALATAELNRQLVNNEIQENNLLKNSPPRGGSPASTISDSNMSPAAIHMGVTNGHPAAVIGLGLGAPGGPTTNEDCGIREVWAHNMEEEFKTICQTVQQFPWVAMDTEFPGVVARPIGEFKSTADYQYQLLRCNVDLLKIIQLGLTFLDETGKLPESGPSTWQFNFKFNLTEDMYAEDSVDLLQNSGIQFEKHEQEGIDPIHFAEIMLVSGLVLREPVKWLSFHSGYDFGYLLNLLTNQNLPKTESEFFELLKLYFPNVYDVKYLMKSCKNLKGGLQEVANELEVLRIGPQHQAGSDSLLTGQTFFKMKEMFFEDDIDDSKYCGHLYGLGTNFVVSHGVNKNNNNSSASLAQSTTTSTTATASTTSETTTSTTTNTTNTASSGNTEDATNAASTASTASTAMEESSKSDTDADSNSAAISATEKNNTVDSEP